MLYFTVLDGQFFLISSVSSWGPAGQGVVSGPAVRGAVPWAVSAQVAKGSIPWCGTSCLPGLVSVAVLSAALDQDHSQWGWPPQR